MKILILWRLMNNILDFWTCMHISAPKMNIFGGVVHRGSLLIFFKLKRFASESGIPGQR